jgi:glutathione S-transferase
VNHGALGRADEVVKVAIRLVWSDVALHQSPHDYEQIPALVERSRLRVTNFLSDLDARLAHTPFVAGDQFSAADITALVTLDFAAKTFGMPAPKEHQALKRWYDRVSARPNITA